MSRHRLYYNKGLEVENSILVKNPTKTSLALKSFFSKNRSIKINGDES